MPNLMVDFIVSLDGYGGADGWPGYWGMEGPEYLAWIKEDEQTEHTTLMGATTYRLLSGYAAEMPDEPGLAALTALPKVVFSSTLEKPLSWANTELVDRSSAPLAFSRESMGISWAARGKASCGVPPTRWVGESGVTNSGCAASSSRSSRMSASNSASLMTGASST